MAGHVRKFCCNSIKHHSINVSSIELSSIVLSSEDTDYFVQYNVFKEINAAKSYMESNPALEEVQLIDISIADEVYHALLAGPFPSKDSAIFHAMTPGMPKDFWVRNAEPLKDLVRI